MKKLLTLVAILIATTSFAQITDTSYSPFTRTGQMLVDGKTYAGNYLDTATNTTAVTLAVVKGKNGHLTYNSNFWGYGYVDMQVKLTGTKISGTVAGYAKIQTSTDSITWYDDVYLAAGTIDTFSFGDVTTQSRTWTLRGKIPTYLRLVITGRGTQSSSWKAQWEFIKPQEVQVSK